MNYTILLSQAPSLLITLINMFLEIASAPKVPHPDDPTNTENEYSVFGPSEATATVQVYIATVCVCVCVCVNIILPCTMSQYYIFSLPSSATFMSFL